MYVVTSRANSKMLKKPAQTEKITQPTVLILNQRRQARHLGNGCETDTNAAETFHGLNHVLVTFVTKVLTLGVAVFGYRPYKEVLKVH